MKNTITLIFILFSVSVFAQSTFDNVFLNPYLPNGGASGWTIHQIGDTLFVFGVIVVEDARGNNILQKYDLEGNLLNTQLWDPEDETLDANLGRWGAVDYTLSGDTGFFTIPYIEFDNSIDLIDKYIMTLDVNGHELSKNPLAWDDRFGYGIIQSRSINFHEHFFCGPSWDSTGLTSLYDNGFLLKTNEFGETLWAQTYDSVLMFRFMNLMDDGGVLLGGYVNYGGTQGGENLADNIIIKTDSLGVEQWRYIHGYDGFQGYCPVIEASDGTIITVGIDGSIHNGANGLDEGPFWFQRIQDNGDSFEIIDEAAYGDHILYDHLPYGIKETSDGGFVCYGWGKSGYNPDTDDIEEEGVILKVDANLDSLWWHYYEHYDAAINGTDAFYDMVIGQDDCMYLTGKAEESALSEYPNLGHIWLVKLDANGCLEPGCNEVGVETFVIGLQNSMKVFPNPVQNQLQIEFTLPSNFHPDDGNSLMIIDSQGRNVGTYTLDDYFQDSYVKQIDVSSLSAGAYTVHWLGDDGRKLFDSVRIVKS